MVRPPAACNVQSPRPGHTLPRRPFTRCVTLPRRLMVYGGFTGLVATLIFLYIAR